MFISTKQQCQYQGRHRAPSKVIRPGANHWETLRAFYTIDSRGYSVSGKSPRRNGSCPRCWFLGRKHSLQSSGLPSLCSCFSRAAGWCTRSGQTLMKVSHEEKTKPFAVSLGGFVPHSVESLHFNSVNNKESNLSSTCQWWLWLSTWPELSLRVTCILQLVLEEYDRIWLGRRREKLEQDSSLRFTIIYSNI